MSARIIDVPTAWAGRLSSLQLQAWAFHWRFLIAVGIGREPESVLQHTANKLISSDLRSLARLELARRERLL